MVQEHPVPEKETVQSQAQKEAPAPKELPWEVP